MKSPAKKIVIIGAGPGGICAGIELLKAGYDNFVILEKTSEFGGVWRSNTYPGAACDVQSHLYCYSFEPNPEWSMPCSLQPEILAYFQSCAKRYGLPEHTRFGVEIVSATWSDRQHDWTLVTGDGESIKADIVISAIGMFNELLKPDIPGLDDFEGTVFHSAEWRHDHDLTGRRVAVIGTAASAVQLIPMVAPKVAQLDVYQRTPNWILPAEDVPYDQQTRDLYKNDPVALLHKRLKIFRNFTKVSAPDAEFSHKAEIAGRENIANVNDPVLREKLTPNFPFHAKRVLQSNIFYPTFNRPNVELVTEGIERITKNAIISKDGNAREVDTIILATGFIAQKFLSLIDVYGIDGRSLREVWSGGAQAYLGITVSGFPNIFMLYGPNTNNGSILYMMECQIAYILRHLERMHNDNIDVLNVRQETQDSYNRQLQKDLSRYTQWTRDTNSYYFSESGLLVTQCPYVMSEYRELTAVPDDQAYEAVSRKVQAERA